MKYWWCLAMMMFSVAHAGDQSLLMLQSSAFKNQSTFPKLYTCDGKDINPPLTWSTLPPKTRSLALILSDIDAPAGTFYHWVLYNIPTAITSFPENIDTLPRGTVVAKNSWGRAQYNGPCPPKGATHYYVFTLYALDSPINLKANADANVLLDAIQKHILDKVELSATYGRTR